VPTVDVVPDDTALRHARRGRVLAQLEAASVDVLVVGREGNARYVSGAPRLWTAGSRAFGPGCVLVRASGLVHLLSTWDEGIPEEIPRENLYGISFNSGKFLRALQNVEGAATARVVATDALTGASLQLLTRAFPAAELVDAEPILRRARQVKTPEEVEAIGAAVVVAQSAVAEAEAALAPGVTERGLTGVFMQAMAAAGVTTPSSQDVAWITSRHEPWRRAGRDVPVAAGDLVAFEGGVVRNGYTGEVGRTRRAGGGEVDAGFTRTWDALRRRLHAACRAGAALSGLLDAYAAAGVAPPPMPVARGLGLGYDLPLVTPALPKAAAEGRFETGMVLALTTYVWQEGLGALYGVEPVHITPAGPEFLSTMHDESQGAH
jgi:Xaa-Pro aminopeptidase